MLSHLSKNPTRCVIIFYLFHVWVVANDIDNYTTITPNWLKDTTESKEYDIQHAVQVLKEVMRNISLYIGDLDQDVKPISPKCFKVQCRVICSNGKMNDIANDISYVMTKSEDTHPCEIIEELYLYNYKFHNAIVPVGFLSTYINKINALYMGISNITKIEDGAFGNGIFKRITLEDLRLEKIDKGFFLNISAHLKGISIIQHTVPLLSVYPDFLDYVTFQLEFLRLQIGIQCVRNISATDPIMGALVHVDFSYNNFRDQLLADTFCKLTMVERLVLTYSNIFYLPKYIFQSMKYLEYLDISHNKLMTISKLMFGIHEISTNLRIYASYNYWHCDCQLQQDMNEIFKYHNTKVDMYCVTPEECQNWMVFDERLCDYSGSEIVPIPPEVITSTTTPRPTTTTRPSTTFKTTTFKTTPFTTTSGSIYNPTITTTVGSLGPSDDVLFSMECSDQSKNKTQLIKWPQLHFYPKYFGSLIVKVTVERSENASSFGLFWFSKTTKEYYMMELLPDEYGLGCYFTMPMQTIVTNLMPNVAYTFCLVHDQQTSVSPFSCKSVHVGGNLDTYYGATYSRNMRAKGISLMVLGVVVFMILGILFMFLVLRQKPIWLKGSKRIIKPKYSSGEIVVLPRTKTAKRLRNREDLIMEKKQRYNSLFPRRSSLVSIASSDSYMNPNFYEMIPAYLTFDKVPQANAPSQSEYDIFDSCHFRPSMAERGSVRYAQIKPRTTRVSSDPLPAIPTDS